MRPSPESQGYAYQRRLMIQRIEGGLPVAGQPFSVGPATRPCNTEW